MLIKPVKLTLILSVIVFLSTAHADVGLDSSSSSSYSCLRVLSRSYVQPPEITTGLREKFSIFTRFLREAGNHDFSEGEVISYYANNEETRQWLSFNFEATDAAYKINQEGEFQIQDWQTYYAGLFDLQTRWSFDFQGFIDVQGEDDFIHAKRKQYAGMFYNPQTFKYEQRPYYFMKEWGGLSHPPVAEITEAEVSLVNAKFSPEGAETSIKENSIYKSPEFHNELDQRSESELTVGNELELLLDDKSYEKKMRNIREAKESIYVSSLVFVSESTVTALVDLLIQRHQEGLDVKVMAEGVGSIMHGQEMRRLKRAGVPVVYASDFLNHNSIIVYHTKVIITDGVEVIVGGQNMLDADLASKGIDLKNRDADMWARGPMTADALENFMKDWNYFISKGFSIYGNHTVAMFSEEEFDRLEETKESQRANQLRGSNHYESWFSNYENRPSGMARFIGQSPYRNIDTITEAHLMYLNGLQDYLVLTTPHIFDTLTEDKPRGLRILSKRYRNFNRLFQSIKAKLDANSGIEMDLLTTGVDFSVNEATPMTEARMQRLVEGGNYFRANMNLLWLMRTNRRLYQTSYDHIQRDWIPQDNVRVWTHLSYLHSKIWLFDRMVASVGSFNFHYNATDHSYEATVLVQDEGFLKQVEQELSLDLANSSPMM